MGGSGRGGPGAFPFAVFHDAFVTHDASAAQEMAALWRVPVATVASVLAVSLEVVDAWLGILASTRGDATESSLLLDSGA